MNTVVQPDAAGGNKKRKTYEQRYAGPSRARKVRLRRGALNELVNQPEDVLYEVQSSVDLSVLILNYLILRYFVIWNH